MRSLIITLLVLSTLPTKAQNADPLYTIKTEEITALTQHSVSTSFGTKRIYWPANLKYPDSLYVEIYNINNILVAKGYYRPVFKKGEIEWYFPIGHWEYFYDDGITRRSGSYTQSGRKMNDWKKYNKDGSVAENVNDYTGEFKESEIERISPDHWELIPLQSSGGATFFYY